MISSNVVLTMERLEREIEIFGNSPDGFVYDVETLPSTLGEDDRGVPARNQVLWFGMAMKGRAIQIPMGHPVGTKVIGETREPRVFKDGKTRMFRVPVYEPPPEQLTRADVFPLVNKLLADPGITKGAHGATFDNASVAKYRDGQIPAGRLPCTIVMRWLCDENRKRYGLKYITKDIYNFVYDDEEVGRQVEKYPFNMVAHYLHCDVKYTWLEYVRNRQRIHEQGLDELFEMETELVSTLSHMRTVGVRIDKERLESLREDLGIRVEEIEKQVWQAAGRKFNINAARQKQEVLWKPKAEGGQGLKPWKLTDTARKKKEKAERSGQVFVPDWTSWSTDEESLDSFRGNALVDSLLEYQETSKVLSTYVHGYLGVEGEKEKPNRIFDGKIYPDFVQYGAATGRFSCVSGDTELVTNRGVFRFDEYQPLVGDLVPTHEGRWQPVLRKIYKGRDRMFLVTLSNGAQIKATGEHRIYTPDGWRYVRDLVTGDKAYSYVGFEGVHGRRGEHPGSLTTLRGQPTEAYGPRGRSTIGDNIPQCPGDPQGTRVPGQAQIGAGTPLFSLEDVEAEPDVRKEWFPASRVPGSHLSGRRVLATQGGRSVRAAASPRDGAGAGTVSFTNASGRAPYRRGQAQQLTGQPGPGNQVWTREAARQEVRVREVAPVGTMGVWDIEVAGDHSYAAHGFLNHNCRAPNLQNVPAARTDLGKLVRSLFIADPGWKLIAADYGQIELVILADLAYKETGRKGALWQGFHDGIDPHTMTAAMVLGKRPSDVTKNERQRFGKSLNFAVVYGAGIGKVASMAEIGMKEAKALLAKYNEAFPEVGELRMRTLREAKRHSMSRDGFPPHTKTILGRMRRLPCLNSPDKGLRAYNERQAFNARIQGSSADLTKMAMNRYMKRKQPHWQLLLTIHDEIITTAPADEAENAASVLVDSMCGEGIRELLTVPLTADPAIADNWADAKE